jgi:GNAT superfamily N-acetyltransferase
VLQVPAAPLVEVASLEGFHLRRRRHEGVIDLAAISSSGEQVGELRVYVAAHGDPFYGRYSAVDDAFAYASKLEVDPAVRGRGLGAQLMRAGRSTAYEESGRGLKSLIAPDNAASLRAHERAGFDAPSTDLSGVRIGARVIWLSRRTLDP